jgi:serine/threonine-protein kinase
MTLGTPLYMSPEQAEGRKLDPRSDIYSLGVTCYHLLSGTPPFDGDTALAVAVKHLKNEPVPLSTLRPDLPPGLCAIVHKMLAKRPDERYPSADVLQQELIKLQAETPALTGASLPPGDLLAQTLRGAEPAVKPKRRHWRYAAWVLVGLIAATAGSLFARIQLRGPGLFAEVTRGGPVPKQETALRQWYFASQAGTEDAWNAVIDYFPENEYLANRARQQLARIYLRRGNLGAAYGIFEDLADEESRDLRSFGLAGQAGILILRNKDEEAAKALAELWPIRESLRDPQMQRLALQVAESSRSQRSHQENAEWDEWFQEHFAGPPLDEPLEER